MNLQELFQTFNQLEVMDEDLDDVLMCILSEKINAAAVDFRALGDSILDQCETGDPAMLNIAEMISLWMIEQDRPGSIEMGLDLLDWLSDQGELSARFNLVVSRMQFPALVVYATEDFLLLETVLNDASITPRLKSMTHYTLGSCYREGHGTETDERKAYEHFDAAAQLGHADAAFQMGLAYDTKSFAVQRMEPDPEKAAIYYAMADRAGSLKGRTNLGVLHMGNRIKSADQAHGRQLLQSAFRDGDVEAGRALQMLDDDPHEVLAKMRKRESDLERINHHCGRNRPSLDRCAERDPLVENIDENIIACLVDVVMHLRAGGGLSDEKVFLSVLKRMETPNDRMELMLDHAFWVRLGAFGEQT